MPFYRNILKQAWSLTWRNKYLWFFGIFAALLGNGGEFEIIFNNAGGDPSQALFPSWQRIASTGVFSRQTLVNVANLLKYDTVNMIMLIVVCLIVTALFLFLVWLVVVSQAAAVNNAAAIIKGRSHDFRGGLDAGMLSFWPVLTLNIIIKAAIYALLAIISLPLIMYETSFGVKLFYVFALIVAVPVAVILAFIMKYAIAYAVIGRAKVSEAMTRGWRLFRGNWLVSLEMAVILFFVNLLVGLAIVLAILTLAVPFLFLGLIFYYVFAAAGGWLIAVLAFTCFIALVILAGAALSIFQISSWTGLFLELDKKSGTAKIVRLINNVVKA